MNAFRWAWPFPFEHCLIPELLLWSSRSWEYRRKITGLEDLWGPFPKPTIENFITHGLTWMFYFGMCMPSFFNYPEGFLEVKDHILHILLNPHSILSKHLLKQWMDTTPQLPHPTYSWKIGTKACVPQGHLVYYCGGSTKHTS